jgi:hypothetical protein
MSRVIEVLAVDWEPFRLAFPGLPDEDLAERALSRGRAIVAAPLEDRVPETLHPGERLSWLRAALARKAASVAIHRFELVTTRERFVRAEHDEQASYERHLELHKDVVPPLKLEAKALRSEVRRLEEQARGLGIDVDALEPRIDWPETMAVDDYQPPRYETNESRKRAAVEFFRRVRGR